MELEPWQENIIRYEDGDLTEVETVALFQFLVDSGHAWTLQSQYADMAAYLIQRGKVTGEIPERVTRGMAMREKIISEIARDAWLKASRN